MFLIGAIIWASGIPVGVLAFWIYWVFKEARNEKVSENAHTEVKWMIFLWPVAIVFFTLAFAVWFVTTRIALVFEKIHVRTVIAVRKRFYEEKPLESTSYRTQPK